MEDKNKLNELGEMPLANVSNQELKQIKELEQSFGDKYYLIALDKDHK
ncbi:hypothetical protein [Alkaliphilus oremlandii]|uniref:Uncharacterized protein n=1 Tax=Alkaliphilus oremlandii (strain OhILAs) TaxID=350688 RepID=A8MKU1_ALKOO|nr:hypothetical protein [Alkaliphilus oremlandii]ABW17758.1 hypothetical protein Clos_0192 [Alkaliphilus oremlandii OhILAs]